MTWTASASLAGARGRRLHAAQDRLAADEWRLLVALSALSNLVVTLEAGAPHDVALRMSRRALNGVLKAVT